MRDDLVGTYKLKDWHCESGVAYMEMDQRFESRNLYMGWSPDRGGGGFTFMASEFVAEVDHEVYVARLCDVLAFFDGVRHVQWKREDKGYDYYPEWGNYRLVLDKLEELENLYCPNKD